MRFDTLRLLAPASRRPLLALALLTAFAVATPAAPARGADAPTLATEDQKILYVLGLEVARNLKQFGLTQADLEAVQAGIADGILGREVRVPPETYGPKLEGFAKARTKAIYDQEIAAGAPFLAAEQAKPGVKKTATGLLYAEITAGTGASPKPDDTVTVHYQGTLRNGKVFDSSIVRGKPATFALNQVIPCWTEGVGMMKVGGKSRLVCPAAIAYGERGTGPIAPGSTLIFEIELLAIGAPAAAGG